LSGSAAALSPRTEAVTFAGPAGAIEGAVDRPDGPPRGVGVVCHPHPQGGGTMDNKVAVTVARAFVQLGWTALRFNYRGVGASAGAWDDGRGEVDDALAAIAHARTLVPGGPLALGGFSFGGFVAAEAASRLAEAEKPRRLVLVAPSTERQAVPAVPPDTLVVHGDADELVPLASTLAWARPMTLPVLVLPGVGHFFHGRIALLKQILLRELHDLAAV
jgi:alpha/beta superfamily hydrolase